MIPRWFYRWAQRRQSMAKKAKDPSFRTCRHIRFVEARLAKPWKEPILCLGPRNVIELQRLREAGADFVVGLDLFSQHPDILVGDMHAMKFSDSSFGMIWASHVLEHALKPALVGREIARVIKPGGYLFAAWPTAFRTNYHDRWDHGHPRNLEKWIPGARLWVPQHTVIGHSEEWAGLYWIDKP